MRRNRFIGIGVVCSALLFGIFGTSASAQLQSGTSATPAVMPDFVPGEILVKFKANATEAEIGFTHAAFGAEAIYTSPYAGFQRVKIHSGRSEFAMVALYEALPSVEYAELNTICRATGVPNDPYYSYQWHFPMINMADAWDVSTGSGVVVAILDSGVAYENYPIPSHEAGTVASGVTQYVKAPDLAGTSFVSGYDFINGDSHPNDNNSHGTHVAGTIAQTTNNGTGVAGVAYNASIMPVKVLDYSGSGSAAALADGLYFVANNGADVANMSLSWASGYDPGTTVHNAITAAYNAGVVLVAAAGNEGVSTVSYPAAYSEVIAVGAVRYDENLSYYSQYGSGIEIVAPGGDVTIDQNGDGYNDGVLQMTFSGYSNYYNKANPTSFSYYFFQGTSMASPHIAGVVALMIANGASGVENIRTTLQDTAKDLGANGYDTTYGHGLVDAAAALGGGQPADTTAPNPDPMTWASGPAATGTTTITMTATSATDASGVEYFFDCLTTGGHDSGWQNGTTYVDSGLTADTTYSYRVMARDESANQNATGYSSTLSATTDSLPPVDTTAPNPDPMTWASIPTATGTSSITMTATTATDLSGVEYYFDCLTAGGHDSGWQSGTTWVDTGLAPDSTYSYRVMARDLSPNQNGTAYSSTLAATTDPPAGGWVELTYDDFESGWGNYVDGGGDCYLYTAGTYAHQGNNAGGIQDNSGVSSSFYYGSGVDVHNPGYSQIKIEFWFKAYSMDNSREDFWVQYYDGSTWHTVARYARTTDFENNIFYFKEVVIDEGSYTFPTNMKIRFMCDASGNKDDVMIDEIRVSAQ